MNTGQCATIIVHYGEWPPLEECIEALTGSGVDPARVVVVDNGSPNSFNSSLLPAGVKYLKCSTNRGFAGGANAGLEYAVADACEFGVLLNTDAVVSSDALDAMVRCMRAQRDIAICGPVIVEDDDARPVAGARIDWRAGRVTDLAFDNGEQPDAIDVDYVAGCGMLVRLSALESFGTFDENYFLYFEDADLCVRASRAGWRVAVCTTATIQHLRSRTTAQTGGLVPYYMSRNALYFFQKHSRGAFRRLTVAVRLVTRGITVGLRCVIGGLPEEGRGRLRGVSDYCRSRFGRSQWYRHQTWDDSDVD